jgi:hypothetical protein
MEHLKGHPNRVKAAVFNADTAYIPETRAPLQNRYGIGGTP